MHFKKYFMTGILLCFIFLNGCAGIAEPADEPQENDSLPDSAGAAPEFDYEVPVSLPYILVNQLGYLPEGKKMAVFRGDNIPESFDIIDEQTGEAVYSGRIEDKGYNEIIGEYNGYGTFDDFSLKGSYYIQAPVIGRSYTFSISEDIYENVFLKALKEYYVNRCGVTLPEEYAGEASHNACHTQTALLSGSSGIRIDVSGGWHMDGSYTRGVVNAGQTMASLLLAYELYPDAFDDSVGIPESGNGIPDILDEIKYEADWMLKMQDSAAGGVYSEAAVSDSGRDIYVGPVTSEATAAFAAIMAKFSHIYQAYDTVYAAECLRAADRAWQFLESGRQDKEAGQRFFAAAELYRATGYGKYRKAAEEYLTGEIYKDTDNNYVYWGCITYISTRRKVDIGLCERAMKSLLSAAEEAAENARVSQYLTAGNKVQDNNEQLLHEMMRLTIADHIITNHEYEAAIENHMHYFMGRNAKAVSYIDGAGENNYAETDTNRGIMNRLDLNSELIFMMSGIMSRYRT